MTMNIYLLPSPSNLTRWGQDKAAG